MCNLGFKLQNEYNDYTCMLLSYPLMELAVNGKGVTTNMWHFPMQLGSVTDCALLPAFLHLVAITMT